MLALAVILTIGMGLAAAAQSPTNASLGLKTGMFQASLVSFAGGFLTLLVISAVTGGITRLSALAEVQPWQVIGGLYGAFMVFSAAKATPKLGVALSLTMMMLGQLVGGLVVDGFGLLLTAQVPVSPLRVLGCVLVLAGIVLVYIGGRASAGLASEAVGAVIGCALLTFTAGVLNAIQLPTNASLGAHVGVIQASLVNFAVGTLALLLVTLVTGKGRFASMKGIRPWQCTGGLYGAFGVVSMVTSAPVLGVSLSLACAMFGQLVGGMAVDSKGLFKVRRQKVNRWRLAGSLVLLAGVALVTVSKVMVA